MIRNVCKQEKHECIKESIIAVIMIVFCVTFSFTIFAFIKECWPFGNNAISIGYGDMTTQTVPENIFYLWDVLHGKASFFFSWNVNLGIEILGAASEQSFLSPLNLCLYFVNRDGLVDFILIFILVKVIAMALAMYFYLSTKKNSGIMCVVLSLVYAFGMATLVYHQLIFVMDIAAIFPIIMIGLDQIIYKKKSRLFILSLTICMIVNIYMSAMVLMYILLYSGAHIFLVHWEKKDRIGIIDKLIKAIVISMALSAWMWIPSLLAIMGSGRAEALNIKDAYFNALDFRWSDTGEQSYIAYLFMPIALPIFVILRWLLTIKKSNSKDIFPNLIIVIVLIINIIVPGIDMLWHGGSRACWPIRYCFCISFSIIILCSCIVKGYVTFTKISIKQASCFCVFFGISALIVAQLYQSFRTQRIYIGTIKNIGLICELLFIVTFIILYKIFKNFKYFNIAYLSIVGAEIMCAMLVSIDANTDIDTYINRSKIIGENCDEIFGNFVRIKDYDSLLNNNYSLIMGTESLSNYIHVIDKEIQPYFNRLGYSVYWTRLFDNGGTVASDAIMGYQYSLSKRELSELFYTKYKIISYMDETYYLYKNNYYMPLVMDCNCLNMEYEWNKFDNQNLLFNSIFNSDEKLLVKSDSYFIDGVLKLHVGDVPQVIYLYGEGYNNNAFNIVVNDVIIGVPDYTDESNTLYPANYNNGIVNLGIYCNEDVTIKLIGEYQQGAVDVALLDIDKFISCMDKYKDTSDTIINSVERKVSDLKVQIKRDKAGYVVLSIPYSDAYSVKVNNLESEYGNVCGFISLPVNEGNSEIRIEYRAEGYQFGLIITICCVFILLLARYVECKIEYSILCCTVRRIEYGAYTSVLVIYMVVMYIIPIILNVFEFIKLL